MKSQIARTLIFHYVVAALYLLGISLWNVKVAPSALLGCAAALVPKTYFSFRMLRSADNDDAAQWLGYAYRSEIGKWVVMGCIFAAAFATDYPWDPVVLFAGFVLLQISGWFAPMILKGN